MLKFHKNRKQTFECKVEIEGADYHAARPRLILSPTGDNKHIFFEGKIDGGICKVIIPEGLDIARDGNVMLEVLVDNTIFSPWKSTYQMVVESIKVESVEVKRNDGAVRIVEAQIATSKPTVKLIVPKKPKHEYLKEGISSQDRKRVNEFVLSYQKLKDADKKFLREHALPSYKPSSKVSAWGKKVFLKTESFIPKMCMYAAESERKTL